jgi:hypothetical protein
MELGRLLAHPHDGIGQKHAVQRRVIEIEAATERVREFVMEADRRIRQHSAGQDRPLERRTAGDHGSWISSQAN